MLGAIKRLLRLGLNKPEIPPDFVLRRRVRPRRERRERRERRVVDRDWTAAE